MHIVTFQSNLDNDEVVNMLEIFANTLLAVTWGCAMDDEVSACAQADSVCHMSRKDEVTFTPPNADLNS